MGKSKKKPKKKQKSWLVAPPRKKLTAANKLVQRIIELRQVMIDASDFAEVFGFFDKHIARSPALSDAGEPARNQQLEEVLKKSTESTIRGAKLNHFLSINIPKQHFWHGAAHSATTQAMFFYYDDIDMGMLALPDLTGKGYNHYLRFNVTIPISPKTFWTSKRGSA